MKSPTTTNIMQLTIYARDCKMIDASDFICPREPRGQGTVRGDWCRTNNVRPSDHRHCKLSFENCFDVIKY